MGGRGTFLPVGDWMKSRDSVRMGVAVAMGGMIYWCRHVFGTDLATALMMAVLSGEVIGTIFALYWEEE